MRTWIVLGLALLLAAWSLGTDAGAMARAAVGLGQPLATVDFNALDRGWTQARAKALNPRVQLACSAELPERQRYGQVVCGAAVASVNGLPATRMDFDFKDGKLTLLTVEYRKDSYKGLRDSLDRSFDRVSGSDMDPGGANDVRDRVVWLPRSGVILASSTEKNASGNVFIVYDALNPFRKRS